MKLGWIEHFLRPEVTENYVIFDIPLLTSIIAHKVVHPKQFKKKEKEKKKEKLIPIFLLL